MQSIRAKTSKKNIVNTHKRAIPEKMHHNWVNKLKNGSSWLLCSNSMEDHTRDLCLCDKYSHKLLKLFSTTWSPCDFAVQNMEYFVNSTTLVKLWPSIKMNFVVFTIGNRLTQAISNIEDQNCSVCSVFQAYIGVNIWPRLIWFLP